MATLASPGTSISVIDQTINIGAGPGTVPLIFIATQQDKLDPSGLSIAPGTTKANAGQVYSITSQRDLVQTFGDPIFYEVSGTTLNGYPLNEYGVLAGYSFLGISNLGRFVRADIDTKQLESTPIRPSSPAATGTYWFDESALPNGSAFGLFVRSGVFPTEVWSPVTVGYVYNFATGTSNVPTAGDGVVGDYAVLFQTASGNLSYWKKTGVATWTQIGAAGHTATIQSVWPDLTNVSTTQTYWIKVGAAAQGANLVLRRMDATFAKFVQVEAPILSDDTAANTYYSTNSAGTVGQIYIEPVITGTVLPGYTSAVGATSSGNIVTVSTTVGLTTGMIPVVTAGAGTFASGTVVTGITSATTFTVSTVPTVALSGGASVVTGTKPNSFTFNYSAIASSWSALTTIVGAGAVPTSGPVNGQLWFNAEVGLDGNGLSTVDILVADGAGHWQNCTLPGFTLTGTSGNPTVYTQSGDPRDNIPAPVLATNDIWIDTDQTEYPVIYYWSGSAWTLMNNIDQTTPHGIIFRDARPNPLYHTGSYSGENNGGGTAPDLDADAPDSDLYPKGFLLWNTRYSTNNVKVWVSPYLFENVTAEPDDTNGNSTGRWVSDSGNDAEGKPYMGAAAQNICVVRAIQSVIISNEDIRAEDLYFNLIAAPGYVEAIDEMLVLNDDRKNTAFIVGDTPFTLDASGTSLQNWASNKSLALGNNSDGLVSASKYFAAWYPSGLTTNVDGTDVVVPPSHMALRTIAYNDQVAYPWFAPAGLQRGVVNNAGAVGYVNEEGQFVSIKLNEGQRDILYQNGINPIRVMPQGGIVIFGQKTRQNYSSATDRINVVRLENYLRYQLNLLSVPFLFEPNDTTTRRAIKDAFDRFLSELITLRGLYDFLVVCDLTNNTPARIDRNELWIDVAIQPVKAIEYIYIPIRIRNTGASLI